MAKFNFYQEELCTVWLRTHFSVEAETKEKAVKLILEARKEGGDIAEEFGCSSSEYLYETEKLLLPGENDGRATIEIFDEDECLVCNNVNQ